jgi:hypothetical protein
MKSYTRAHLEEVVWAQLENLRAMNDLLIVMKTQTELVNEINKKLALELRAVKAINYQPTPRKKKSTPSNAA